MGSCAVPASTRAARSAAVRPRVETSRSSVCG
jgi:hypothetical protein